jgi:phosphoglycolate phosphatase-like HAD superfamily hydrolase
MQQRYQLLMFDMDGTFLDSAKFHIRAYHRFFQKYNIPVKLGEDIRGMGNTIDEMLGNIGILPNEKEEVYKKLYRFYQGEVDDLIQEIPIADGAKQTFHKLQDLGYRMCVVTNSLDPAARRMLSFRGLAGYFDAIRGATPQESGKENRCAQMIRELCPHGKVLYIGDAARDMEIARELCMDSCLAVTNISWAKEPEKIIEQQRPSYVIHSLLELTDLL